jgi:hypothetical protein
VKQRGDASLPTSPATPQEEGNSSARPFGLGCRLPSTPATPTEKEGRRHFRFRMTFVGYPAPDYVHLSTLRADARRKLRR